MKTGIKRQRMYWIIFLAAMAGFCVAVGWRLADQHILGSSGKIVPAAIGHPRGGRERERLGAAVWALHRRLDSLAADSAGRRSYDSLIHARPGMMDSLKFIEGYFLPEGQNH